MALPVPKPLRRLHTRSPLLLVFPFLIPALLISVPLPSTLSPPSLPLLRRPAVPSPSVAPPPPPAYRIPDNYTTPTHCIIYDRPPHTASTTISEALTKCLRLHGYATTTYPYDDVPPSHVVSDLIFNHSAPGRAASTHHLSISAYDLFLLRLVCAPNLLYITSTRTMPARITSSAKYVLTPEHASSTLSPAQFQHAMDIARSDHVNERRLEFYPFDDPDATLTPDYVIRHAHLETDLQALLQAMQCDTQFETLNVHRGVESDASREEQQKTRDELHLHFGDARHIAMTTLAEQGNEAGLRKAGLFFAAP